MRLAAAVVMIASVASAQLNFNEPGLVWAGLYPGHSMSNAVHNVATTGAVGNTRGPIQTLDRGVASNSTATAAWIGLGTNTYPLVGATEFTLTCWLRAATNSAAGALHNNVPATTATGTFYFVAASATRIYCYVQKAATNYVYYDKSGLPNNATTSWVHLATTWKAGITNMQLFMNGEGMTVSTLRVGANVTNLNESSTENRIGAFHSANSPYISANRSLTMARMYNRALSTNEVRALYMRERAYLP